MRHGAGLALAARMPAKYKVAKLVSNFNSFPAGFCAGTAVWTQFWQSINCYDFPKVDPTCPWTLPGYRLKCQCSTFTNPLRAVSREAAIPIGNARVSGGWRDRTQEAAGSHTNFKVDRGRARTATAIQLSRRRAGGHTPSEMYRVGALDAETNQWLTWGAGTKVGHSGRPQTFNDAQGGCQARENESMVEAEGGSTQSARPPNVGS